MRTCQLGSSGLCSSVLGFGCSAIMGRTGRKDSLRALSLAWDEGVVFFDTARSYGYGESEAVLGEFLRGRRDRAIVSTKFGILARRQPLWKRAAKPVFRALLAAAPAARGAVRKRTAAEFTPNQFSVELLRTSLDASLRKLHTDYVDLLFLHDAPVSVLHNEELLLALDQLTSCGKVRLAGISSTPGVIEFALQKNPPSLMAAQFRCTILNCAGAGTAATLARKGWVGIANQPFGGAAGVQRCRSVFAKIAPLAPAELRSKIQNVNDAVLSDIVLNLTLSTPGVQVVIPAMMKPAHIRDNARAVRDSRFSMAELDWIRLAVATELCRQ